MSYASCMYRITRRTRVLRLAVPSAEGRQVPRGALTALCSRSQPAAARWIASVPAYPPHAPAALPAAAAPPPATTTKPRTVPSTPRCQATRIACQRTHPRAVRVNQSSRPPTVHTKGTAAGSGRLRSLARLSCDDLSPSPQHRQVGRRPGGVGCRKCDGPP